MLWFGRGLFGDGFLRRRRKSGRSGRELCNWQPRSAELHPVLRRGQDAPNVCRTFQLHADLLELARTLRSVYRPDSGAHGRRLWFDIQAHHLECHPGSHAIIVARRIATAMQIQAGGDGPFHEGLTQAILAEDN